MAKTIKKEIRNIIGSILIDIELTGLPIYKLLLNHGLSTSYPVKEAAERLSMIKNAKGGTYTYCGPRRFVDMPEDKWNNILDGFCSKMMEIREERYAKKKNAKQPVTEIKKPKDDQPKLFNLQVVPDELIINELKRRGFTVIFEMTIKQTFEI